MFKVNEDLSIYVTRGDSFTLEVSAYEGDGLHTFVTGDLIRLKVTEKKNCSKVFLSKEVRVTEPTDVVVIHVEGEETKFDEVISKPTDYWYEVELNPDIKPQTIIGYDEDGAKVFRLFPEGGDMV
jgi:hypothetical protein